MWQWGGGGVPRPQDQPDSLVIGRATPWPTELRDNVALLWVDYSCGVYMECSSIKKGLLPGSKGWSKLKVSRTLDLHTSIITPPVRRWVITKDNMPLLPDFHHLLTLIGAYKQEQEIGCEHRSVTCWSSAGCWEPKQAQTQRKAETTKAVWPPLDSLQCSVSFCFITDWLSCLHRNGLTVII